MAKATTTTKKTTTREPEATGGGNNHDRRKLIAESAYFRAQRRGFNGGNPVEDWLAAEREIDAMLRSERPRASAR